MAGFLVRNMKSVQLIRKEDSFLCKSIHIFLLVISFGRLNAFMTDYVSTLFGKIYTPTTWDSWGEASQQRTIRHEYVHIAQAERYGSLLFSLMYTLCPLPIGLAYFRMLFEMEAYAETCIAIYEQTGRPVPRKTIDWIVSQMTGPSYFWTWPFADSAEKHLRRFVSEKTTQQILE